MLMKRASGQTTIVRSASRETDHETTRKKALKTLLIFIAIMLVLTLTSRALNEMSVALVTVTTPQRGSLERSVTADGTLAAGEEIPFWMGTVYRISDIYVSVGDEVQEGDPLFSFDMEQLQTQYEDALVALEKMLNNRERSLIDTSISAPDTTVSDAQRSLERQQENYAQSLDTQDRNVASAQSDLDASIAALATARAEYEQEYATQSQDLAISAQESLVKASQSLVNAQNSYTSAQFSAQDSENKARQKLSEAQAGGDASAIAQAEFDLTVTLANNTSNLTKAQQSLENAQYDYYKAQEAANNLDVESKVSSKANAVESAEKDVETKQKALENAVRSRDTAIRDAQRSLDDAQTSYDKAVASASAKNKSEQASEKSEALNLANTDLDIEVKQKEIDAMKAVMDADGVVLSTMSGTIISMNLTRYATPSTNSPLMTFAGSNVGMKLALQVSSTNADYMTVGDDVTVTLSGGGFARSTIAEINAITGNADMYEIVIYLDADSGSAGDKVRMRFTKRTDSYDSLIPIAALRQDTTGYFVYAVRQEESALGARKTVERVDVVVVDQDSTRVAVSSGIGRNDTLVERSDRSLSDGDRVRTE